EAIRILKINNPNDVLLILVSFLPLQNLDSELKTKPTQYAVKTLNSTGLQPDIILARAVMSLDKKRKEKIAFNCSMQEQDIISAPDVESIYEVPVNFEKDGLSNRILEKLKLRPRKVNLEEWRRLALTIKKSNRPVNIGIVGKYFSTGKFILADSYISVIEAIKHAAYYFGRKPVIKWIEAEEFINKPAQLKQLLNYDGIIVPGGFGGRGTEGKIAAIGYCRKNKIPFFGLCYGMQLAVVEFSRSLAGLKKANSTEIDPKTPYPVIDILPEQKKNLEEKKYGATMRLGAYPAALKKGTIAFEVYKKQLISERHRHRYEVNPDFIKQLEGKGLVFSGSSPDGRLMEIMELPKTIHPFFVATQFHPEFKSRPLDPHPLFKEFIKTAINKK
ncbi:MAG: CTP synthase, partial [bacterium]|nr:CTP synthase [bacterium]